MDEGDAGIPGPAPCDYAQVFGTAQHTGLACPEVTGMRVVSVLPSDPDADEKNDFFGFYQQHPSAPLVQGNYIVIPETSGFVDGFDRSPERWGVQTYRWVPSVTAPNAQLTKSWHANTAWQPVDSIIGSLGTYTNGYVAQFQPAIFGASLYVPSRFGRVTRYDLATGAVIATIDPFAGTAFSGDDRTIVTNALSVDGVGNVYYTVTSFNATSNSNSSDTRGQWLVHVRADNTSRIQSWAQIATRSLDVPGRNDLCEYPFGTLGTPPATGPSSRPPMFRCGTQRPAFNSPVAISTDNHTLVVWSYANNATSAAFLISLNAATLQPLSASDTRGHLLYGCGVRLDINSPECQVITGGGTQNIGFDPEFNGPVRFRGEDLMDSAPAIAPNGDISIGSYDGGFQFGGDYDARGGGLVFTAAGAFSAKNETFWWEVTPSVIRHSDGGFSYLQDRQRFEPENDLTIARYSAIQIEERLSFHPDADFGNSFQDAHIVFGPNGDHYGLSSTGHLHKYDSTGRLLESLALPDEDGEPRAMFSLSVYAARDRAGRIYVFQGGSVYVIEGGGAPSIARPSAKQLATARAGFARRNASLGGVVAPLPAAAVSSRLASEQAPMTDDQARAAALELLGVDPLGATTQWCAPTTLEDGVRYICCRDGVMQCCSNPTTGGGQCRPIHGPGGDGGPTQQP